MLKMTTLPIVPQPSSLWFASQQHGAAVAAQACPDVPSSIPLGCGLFSPSIFQWHVLKQVPRVGAMLTEKSLARQLEAKQA